MVLGLYCVCDGAIFDLTGRKLRKREQQHVDDGDWAYIDIPKEKEQEILDGFYVVKDKALDLLAEEKRPSYIPPEEDR